MTIEEHVPLAPLTTFNIGGAARYVARANSVDETLDAIAFVKREGVALKVLGGGSNVLIADDGFNGLMLQIAMVNVAMTVEENHVSIKADAGASWDDLVAQSVQKGFWGLECLSGIPGTVGGAVVANIGSYGVELAEVLHEVRVLDLENIEKGLQTIPTRACAFSYRNSVFKQERDRWIIFGTTLVLPITGVPHLAYRDHRFNLETIAKDHQPSVAEIREVILKIREKKGMLAMGAQAQFQSAGSFFLNPIVSPDILSRVTERAKTLNAVQEERLRPWAWPLSDGSFKIAAAFLLEYTPFSKGYVRDRVGISPVHQLALINRGGARANAVAALARDIQNAVKDQFGIMLEREVEYVGTIEP